MWLKHPAELNSESISSWISDLMTRLDFLYAWAVEGPPLVMQLGALSRPKTFLTAIQQVGAGQGGQGESSQPYSRWGRARGDRGSPHSHTTGGGRPGGAG